MSTFVALKDGSFDLCFPMLTFDKEREEIFNTFNKTILQFLLSPYQNRANPFACFRGKQLNEKELVTVYRNSLLTTSSNSVIAIDQCFSTLIEHYKIIIIIGVLLFILMTIFFIIMGIRFIKAMEKKKSVRISSLFDGEFRSVSSLLLLRFFH